MQLDLAVHTTQSLLMMLPHRVQKDTNCSLVSMGIVHRATWILKSVGSQVCHRTASTTPRIPNHLCIVSNLSTVAVPCR